MKNIAKKFSVCDLKYSKRLKELGVKQESLWWWTRSYLISRKDNDPYFITLKPYGKIDEYSAFTCAELGKKLIKRGIKLITQVFEIGKNANYKDGIHLTYNKVQAIADTEANARARLLIYDLEKKLK